MLLGTAVVIMSSFILSYRTLKVFSVEHASSSGPAVMGGGGGGGGQGSSRLPVYN